MAQYIYGKNSVLQRMNEKKEIDVIYITEGNELLNTIKKLGYDYKVVNKQKIDSMSKGNHQGIVARIPDYKTYTLDEITENTSDDSVIVMLDGIVDPHNLGAILRTCDAAGAGAVVIGENRNVGLNPTVAKVAVGAIETVKVCPVVNLSQTIKTLKKRGYWIIGSSLENAVDYREVNYSMPVVLVIGSEGKGLSRLVKENCDYLIKIPMYGRINSLNASVATGIMLYQISNTKKPLGR